MGAQKRQVFQPRRVWKVKEPKLILDRRIGESQVYKMGKNIPAMKGAGGTQ